MKKVFWIIILSGLVGCAAQPSQKSQVVSAKNSPVQKARKLLYYRSPMDPTMHSPVPMKDSMGMDYVPVYEEENATGHEVSGIHVKPTQQQLIGVKIATVRKRDLVFEIRASGRVAFDPDLYIAQSSYIEALKASTAAEKSSEDSLIEQSKALLEASRRNLYLQGMSDAEIDQLSKAGHADDSLYYPGTMPTIWVYAAVYEDEAWVVKPGQKATFEAPAFPGKMFQGTVFGISPVLNAETRTTRVRVKIDDPARQLRPQMFGTVKISVDLGPKLAVAQDAVLQTGQRQIVYVVHKGDIFQMREVTLGTQAQGYYEVLSGLKEGDKVVVSGNFLIDSESRLEGVVQ